MNGSLAYLALAVAMTAPLVKTVRIGPVKIELEETTFAEVAKHLGEAPIVRGGDAGGSRSQACYISGRGGANAFYLESGEMGGGERITQVDIVSAGHASAAEDPLLATQCRTIPNKITTVRTNSGVRLGLSRSELERLLKVHGRDSSGVTIYEQSSHVGSGSRAYDVSSWLRVRYANRRVVAFSTGVVSSS